jgi:hypothetical protein
MGLKRACDVRARQIRPATLKIDRDATAAPDRLGAMKGSTRMTARLARTPRLSLRPSVPASTTCARPNGSLSITPPSMATY